MLKKILVVDDILENIQIIVSIFEKYKPEYKLYQAPDGKIALSIAEKIIPDIIISDWDMPEMDGISFVKLVKKNKDLRDIPVIMATGVMVSVENLQTALDAGAVDYIRKPINEVELVARTVSALNMAEYNNNILKKKNQELIENTLFLIRNNKFNQQTAYKMQELIKLIKNNKTIKIAEEIIKNIDTKIKTDSWKRFEIAFNSVNEYFYQNISADVPNLTQSEIKLAAFLKLGLSSKDIASVMYVSAESVKVFRSRFRKKLNIDQSVNLQSFLSKY
ncbi:MAG: response regulator [Bacteroidales bacterium]|nr:response regulator [Bacteroidales bacterium]